MIELPMDYSKLTKRQKRFERKIAILDRRSRNISWLRLAIFLTTAALVFGLYWLDKRLSGACLFLGTLVFALVAWQHRRVDFSLKRFKLWLSFLQDTTARLHIDWQKLPKAKDFPVDDHHPFNADLNITGDQSLHQLLDICISQPGSARLADWLLAENTELLEIQHRQKLVRELKSSARFRAKFRLAFFLHSENLLQGDKVTEWLAQAQNSRALAAKFYIALILCLANVGLVVWDISGGPGWWLYGLLAYFMFVLANRQVWLNLGEDAEFLDMEFKQAVAVFRFLEKQSYRRTPNLADLCAPFTDPLHKPTRRLRYFMQLAIAIGLRMNYLTAIALNFFFPYDFFCALLLNRQKQRVAGEFHNWLDTLYELDALNSLANFAAIFPANVFPEISDNDSEPALRATALGHPFLPLDQRVCNDFEMNEKGSLVLITGSNMSGKSTFLRTVGVNLVLAYAGAPVAATDFRTSLFRLFCCIRINDSITDGVSQFYAEVKRLKKLQDELGESERPVFYLIDEIFKGTNNRERLIGSRAFIKSLVNTTGLGLISTHDLELAQLGNIRNVHFREHVSDGWLVFDFKLHDGPCPITNALKIMQLEGLPVE